MPGSPMPDAHDGPSARGRMVWAVLLGLLGPWTLLQLASCNLLSGASDLEVVGPAGPSDGASTAEGSSSSGGAGGAGAAGAAGDGGGSAGSPTPVDASADAMGDDAAAQDAQPDALSPDGDEDQDGKLNQVDNCPLDFNPCQYDMDSDGAGDECDATCEEACVVRTCGTPGVIGCNCPDTPAPDDYRCLTDYDFYNGRHTPQPLPDGGTYDCAARYYKVFAERCNDGVCDNGLTCWQLQVGTGCICYSYCSLLPCGTF